MTRRKLATLACALLILALAAPATVFAQAAPAIRFPTRFDAAAPAREIEQVLLIVDIPPGGATPMHTHGGQVFVTVLEGEPTFQVRGGPLRRFKVGESWVEEPGEFAIASNPGPGKVRVGATVVLPKGAPLTIDDAGHASAALPVSVTTVHHVTLPVANPPTPLEVAQVVVEFPAGSLTDWHTHGGQGFVLVTEGEVALERGGGQQRFKAGDTWVDGAGVVNRSGNTTGAPAAIFASFLLPKGAALTTAQPGQTGAAAAPTQLPRTGAPTHLAFLLATGLLGAGVALRRVGIGR